MKEICDRYKIPPGEARILIEAYGEGEKALEGAITYMRERVRLYAIPCRWEAQWLKDSGILVKRYRNRVKKIKVEIKHFGGPDVLPENNSVEL